MPGLLAAVHNDTDAFLAERGGLAISNFELAVAKSKQWD